MRIMRALRPLLICILLLLLAVNGWAQFSEWSVYNHYTIPVPAHYKKKLEQINIGLDSALNVIPHNPGAARRQLASIANNYRDINHETGYATAMMNIGWSYIREGNYKKSLYYYHLARQHGEKSRIPSIYLAMIYGGMSIPFYYNGQYDSMAHYIYRASVLAERYPLKDKVEISALVKVYNIAAGLWLTMNEPKKARYYLQKAKKTCIQYNDSLDLVSTLINTGYTYYLEGLYDSSILYFEMPLNWIEANPDNIIHSRIGLGKTYLAQEKAEVAIEHLQKATQLALQYGNTPAGLDAAHALGEAYYKTNSLVQAAAILTQALRQTEAAQIGLPDLVVSSYSILSDIFKQQGNFQIALEMQHKSHRLKDSLHNIEKIKAINELELKYQTLERKKRLAENALFINKQKAKIKDRNLVIGIMLTAVFLLSCSLFAVFRYGRQKQRLQAAKMKNMAQALHIEKIEAMIQGEEKERNRIGRELHDGSMSQLMALGLNIQSLKNDFPQLLASGRYNEIVDLTAQISKDIHNTSHQLMPEVLLLGLPEAINRLCDDLNRHQSAKIIFQLYDNLPPLDLHFSLSLYRMVQELLQNVIKHAEAQEALVQISCKNGILYLTVEDNGKGFDHNEQHPGAGLKNIIERCRMLKGNIDIQSNASNGTAVYAEFEISLLEQHLAS